MPHDVYQALQWVCEATFFATAPVLLAIRFVRPATMPGWQLILLVASLGWVTCNLAVYFQFEHLDVLLREAVGVNAAPQELIDRWQSDGGPRVGAAFLGWLYALIYLGPWTVLYGIASAIRRFRSR